MRRRKEYMTIFINGKQKRVKGTSTIDGLSPDEFIRRNADPIWLHQNEMWEYMIEDEAPLEMIGRTGLEVPALIEDETEKFWIDKAIRRDEELDSGKAQTYPADEVLAQARTRLRWGSYELGIPW
jgi:hypothetical protein